MPFLQYLLIFLAWMGCTTVFAIEQRFTFYAGENYTGESVVITENSPDLSLLNPVIMNRRSYCVQGWWILFREKNYNENNGIGAVWFSKKDDEYCAPKITNHIYDDYLSLRHVGHSDTNKIGLSLYEDDFHYGKEFYIGDEDAPLVPFPVYAYGMTGNSTWTFYVEPYYGGFRYCVSTPGTNVRTVFPTGTSANIKSVRRGCHT